MQLPHAPLAVMMSSFSIYVHACCRSLIEDEGMLMGCLDYYVHGHTGHFVRLTINTSPGLFVYTNLSS